MHTKFWSESLKGKDHSGDICIDRGDNVRMDHKEIVWKGVDWIHLAQDKDQWWTRVNILMYLQLHKRWEISQLAE
jgi:hypothetical protein